MVPMWMFANAIATGNCFILKPSEKDPSAALYLAELLAQAGLPPGVFTVLQGDKVAVDRILEHPDIAAVSFVGSTPIAKYIYATGTANGKRVQALGGAKNHMIVLPDADINMAADAAVSAAYGSAGERCMAISVVVAVGNIGDAIVDAIAARLPKLKVGPGTDPDAEMGPLITGEHRDKVASYLAGAAGEGATVVVDGRDDDLPAEGFFLGASLVDKVKPGMKVYDDEIFGPVLAVTRVETYEEEMAPRSSPATVALPGSSSSISMLAWSASMYRSRYLWPTTALAVGKPRCLAIAICTVRPGLSSIPALRQSPHVGQTQQLLRSTSDFRALDNKRGQPWISESFCSAPPLLLALWIVLAGPRHSGSAMSGLLTRISCGRSRMSSTAKSLTKPARSSSARWSPIRPPAISPSPPRFLRP